MSKGLSYLVPLAVAALQNYYSNPSHSQYSRHHRPISSSTRIANRYGQSYTRTKTKRKMRFQRRKCFFKRGRKICRITSRRSPRKFFGVARKYRFATRCHNNTC